MARRKRCRTCGKFIYWRDAAFHAATGTARTTGKPVRIYRCPVDSKVYHITTKPRRY